MTPASNRREQAPNRGGGRFGLTAACLLLIALAAALAYANSLTVPFLLDDAPCIRENGSILSLEEPFAVLRPPRESHLSTRPLINLSFALNHAFSAYSVRGYHLTNLGIHILAAFSLFGLALFTLRLPGQRPELGRDALPIAFALSLLWAVHPLNTQAVTYLSQRCESLASLFYLLTLLCAALAFARPRAILWGAASLASFASGLASKEIVITAPAAALAFDVLFVSRSLKKALLRHRALYTGFALLAAAYLFLYLKSWSAPYTSDYNYLPGATRYVYASRQVWALLHYLRLSFWPDTLAFDYGWPRAALETGRLLLLAPLLAVLLLTTIVLLLKKSRAAFPGACFFLVLAPSSSIIPLNGVAFEHRMYIPLAAVAAIFVLGLYYALRALALRLPRAEKGLRAGGLMLLLCLALALGIRTHARNTDYASEISIWRDTVQKRPQNARARNNLGFALLSMGQWEEAAGHLSAAVESTPDYATARLNLAVALQQMGRLPEAVEQLRIVLTYRPRSADVLANLGQALMDQGRVEEGKEYFERALAIDPGFVEGHYNYAATLLLAGLDEEAAREFRRTLALAPGHLPARYQLALLLERRGRLDDAAGQLTQALRLSPGNRELAGALQRVEEKRKGLP